MIPARLRYQQVAAASVTGRVLNIGCLQDPAELTALFGARIVHCDRYALHIDGTPNCADVLFHAGEGPWPFEDDSAELVLFGDVLEHLRVPEIETALLEAARVARAVCITTPDDFRIGTPEYDRRAREMRAGELHVTRFSDALLRHMLLFTGWRVIEWRYAGDYWERMGGWLIRAERLA